MSFAPETPVDTPPDEPAEPRNVPSAMAILASTRTAVVLLALTAVASLVGMILSDPVAAKYIYGRLWFHVLLGLLGVNLVACMVWRKRISAGRAWSLVMHLGLALVLVGAMITLIYARRGAVQIFEGKTVTHYIIPGPRPGEHATVPLGFTLKLVEFRLQYYPPVDYLYVRVPDRCAPDRYRVVPGRDIPVPGTDATLTNVRIERAPELSTSFRYDRETRTGRLRVTGDNGMTWTIPADVGSVSKLAGTNTAVEILRFEPAFVMDLETRKVSSRGTEPTNPAVRVAVYDGDVKRRGSERWLFASRAMPSSGPMLHPARRGAAALVAEAVTPHGTKDVYLEAGARATCPWFPGARVAFEHAHRKIKEFESHVQVLEDGHVVRDHVIRVNDPLTHRGITISQGDYDKRGLRYSVLGVSQDDGAHLVFAGFLATMVGLLGRLYLKPALRELQKRPSEDGGGSGLA